MPSKKKRSKAKGRKSALGKGGANKAEDNVTVNEQKQGTLDSKMQRLRIGEENDDDALLEEAIKLAVVEQQEIKMKEKENCTHGFNPSSRFQAQFCGDFLKTFTESMHAASKGNRRCDWLQSANDAFGTAIDNSTMTTNESKNYSNKLCISPCCLAEGTKFILKGKSDDARLCAVLSLFTKGQGAAAESIDRQKVLEVIDGDEHTLVQFFRKQIPCSCLDEKYKEVKSITKMGICFNDDCPLPDKMAVRSKMFQCTGCCDGYNVSYCSRECQEAHWPYHKHGCGKSDQELVAMRSNK
jgi:hypothetical protein